MLIGRWLKSWRLRCVPTFHQCHRSYGTVFRTRRNLRLFQAAMMKGFWGVLVLEFHRHSRIRFTKAVNVKNQWRKVNQYQNKFSAEAEKVELDYKNFLYEGRAYLERYCSAPGSAFINASVAQMYCECHISHISMAISILLLGGKM